MRPHSFLILLHHLAFVLGLPQFPILPGKETIMRKCATESNSEIIAGFELEFGRDRLKIVVSEDSPSGSLTTIQTYFHIIAANETGWISQSQLMKQLEVINDDFTAAGISFNLASVERSINEDWFLRGGPETNNSIDDGVVILYSCLPGGATPRFNQGRTLTHELGHWLGLYHTFQNGCNDPGDYVSDTPDQASPTPGCPSSRDTCPPQGIDAINDFMDYSYDSCMNNFTPTQAIRMKSQLVTYRNITS